MKKYLKNCTAIVIAAVSAMSAVSADAKEIKGIYTYVYQIGQNTKLDEIIAGLDNLKDFFPSTGNKDDVIEIPDTENVSEYEIRVAELVNEIRETEGLNKLTFNSSLSAVARLKSQDMKDKGYFSHTSPTYGSPYDMMTKFGIEYTFAGENLARGQKTPEQVVNAWMNSPGHRKNILNPYYTQIGVGYVADGNYWTQHFIG